MKVKILIVIIMMLIAFPAIMSIASRNVNIDQNKQNVSENIEKITNKHHTQKKPNKLPISQSNESKNLKISLNELQGYINKEYGIREDILRYIEREIPNNEMAKKAAIKYAQKWNFIYYKATPEEAMKEVTQQLITLDCLRYALKTDKPIPITDGISKLMRNTPERDKYMWDVSSKYFGWKIIEQDTMSEEKLKKICETGDY